MGVITQGQGVGIWGTPTSTVDWCEENYVVCKYMAEFWNTISNFFTIAVPIFAYYMDWHAPQETYYRMQYIALIIVGIGSWSFHGTLLYELQLLDELPMIYGSAVMLYCVNQVIAKPNKHNIPVLLFLIGYSVFTTYVYLVIKNPTFFFFCYGILVFLIVVQTVRIIANTKDIDRKDGIFQTGLTLFLAAFGLWLIDFHFCPILRSIRAQLSYPLSEIFQLHAWWHLGSCFGTHLFILYTNRLRLLHLGYDGHIAFKFGMPYMKYYPLKQDQKRR